MSTVINTNTNLLQVICQLPHDALFPLWRHFDWKLVPPRTVLKCTEIILHWRCWSPQGCPLSVWVCVFDMCVCVCVCGRAERQRSYEMEMPGRAQPPLLSLSLFLSLSLSLSLPLSLSLSLSLSLPLSLSLLFTVSVSCSSTALTESLL